MSLRSSLACVAVIGFFVMSVAAMTIVVNKSALSLTRKRLLVAAIIVSFLAKLALVSTGFVSPGLDPYTWKRVGDFMSEGRSVYANEGRYNWAPAWAWIVLGLRQVSILLTHTNSFEGFRLVLAAFLAVIDILIGLVLVSAYSYAAALVFLLAPCLIWIDAYEGPFNNLALLIGLLAWLMLRKKDPAPRAILFSALLIGMSIVVKHILAVFPIWLLFYKPLGKLRHRVGLVVVAYAFFFCSFLPWWNDPASNDGITEHVFRYNSNYGWSLIGAITTVFIPIAKFDAIFYWVPVVSPFEAFWLVLMVMIGILAARLGVKELFPVYLLALYGTSPGVWEEYLVIPMFACAIFCESWASWAYIFSANATMVLREGGTSRSGGIEHFRQFWQNMPSLTVWGDRYTGIFMLYRFGWEPVIFAGQFCAIALLAVEMRRSFVPGRALFGYDPPESAESVRWKMAMAVGLFLVGYLPWTLGLVVQTAWERFVS